MTSQNKYKTARLLTGMTREEAAPELFMSESTLKRIENGEQPCSPEKAMLMPKLYGFPWVADPTVPEDYQPMPRAQAMLKYLNEREDVDRLVPQARRILADGVVDGSKAEELAAFQKEIQEERAAGRDLLYAI